MILSGRCRKVACGNLAGVPSVSALGDSRLRDPADTSEKFNLRQREIPSANFFR
jgi:hypothetical protein